MKKVLLCPPTFYNIEYEINPWMHVQNNVDHKKAQEEYLELKSAYQELGLELLEISQEKGLPDMVYAANFGYPKDNFFIKSNFKFDERKKEAELSKKYFENLGFEIKKLPENVVWEGQGDLLSVGGKYFLGWGKRSDYESKKYLSEILEAEITDFKLIDPYFYHFDMCFTPLNENTVAINPLSFDEEGLEKISQNFSNIIEVSEEDNKLMACNAVVVDNTIIASKGISEKLKDDYLKHGFSVKEISMDEFRKGGGGIKCLTLEFY